MIRRGSLRGRLVVLCALVAALSTGLGLLAAHQALDRALAESAHPHAEPLLQPPSGTPERALARPPGRSVLLALLAGGVASVLLAVALGTVVGWYWLDPLRLVARAAAARARDPAARLPDPTALPLDEAREIAAGLQALDTAGASARQELELALDRARTANLVHRRFLTQLGHEFGQPLRRIIEAAGDPARAAELRRAGLELEARLQDVLGLVPPGSQATGLPVDLAGYAQGVLALVRARAADAGTALTTAVPPWSAQLDAALLTPVLINLLANAIAAAPGGRVELGAAPDERGVQWSVRDDGRGLDPARAAAIAAALHEGGVAAGDERIGLGLALCLANLRAMGGRLELSSPGPGQGTVANAWVPWPGRGMGA